MRTMLIAIAGVLAVTSAVRSTWSPCGVSMLATITPYTERARGHRFQSTAAWFVVGALLGGCTFGVVMAVLAAGVAAVGLGSTTLAAAACIASALVAASDARLNGFQLPAHHRQVNERWLDGFRPWVYGVGFGWQIGSGLATYIKTATVYLVVVISALTGAPWVALGIGVLFGLVRGCAVYLGRKVNSPAELTELHRRLAMWDPRARTAVIATAVGAAILFALVLSPWAALVLAAVATAVTAWRHSGRRQVHSPA